MADFVSAVQCSVNVSINNGYVKFSQHGKFAAFHCNSGYRLVGASLVVCKGNGTWSSSPPKCGMVNVVISGLRSYTSKIHVYCLLICDSELYTITISWL